MATSNAAQFQANMYKRALVLDKSLETIAKKAATDIKRHTILLSPAPRTGNLNKGWKGPESEGKWTYKVSNDVEYAIYVEKGTRRMAGRHMLGNAVHLVEPKMHAAVRMAMRKAAS